MRDEKRSTESILRLPSRHLSLKTTPLIRATQFMDGTFIVSCDEFVIVTLAWLFKSYIVIEFDIFHFQIAYIWILDVAAASS